MSRACSSSNGLPGASRSSRASDDDLTITENRFADVGRIQLQPVTRTTTVQTVTTTTTTLSYPPLLVPHPAKLALLSEADQARLPPSSRIVSRPSDAGEPLDPKLYPLATVRLPAGLDRFAFDVGPDAALFTAIGKEDKGEERAPLSPRIRKSAASAVEVPPRKRARSERTRPEPSILPSPPLDGDPAHDFAPASPLSDAGKEELDAALFQQGESLAYSADVAVLLSLPSVVEEFSRLAPNTQSYVLFNLLQRSTVPVLQRVSSIIEPALKRDFLTDLPLELVTSVLCCLDGRSLCLASQVCKSWQQRIIGDGRAWLAALRAEDLFVGDGSEEREANRLMGRGAPTPEELFFRQWQAGFWDMAFDQEAAALPTVEKIAFALKNAPPRPLAPSLGVSPLLAAPTSPMLFGPSIAPRLTGNTTHPYKLLYKERVVGYRRWRGGEPKRMSFAGHSQMTVTCLQFDRKRIISASDEHLINVFQTTTGKSLGRLQGHEGGVWCLQYLGNILVSGSTDRTVRVWDLNRMRNTHTFVGHTSTVRCLQIIEPINVNPDPMGTPIWEPPYPLIVTGSRDCTLRTWKLPSPNRDDEYHPFVPLSPSEDESHFDVSANRWHLRHFKGHRSAVRALAAHGRTFVSGSYDYTVRIWDALDGECKHILQGHTGKIYSVVYDPATHRCASGSMDGSVRLWSTMTGECLRHLDGHTSLVGLLGLSSDVLISAAADATLRLWHPETGDCKAILSAHAGAITCFQHDQHKVISGSDGTLKLWDVKTGLFIRDLIEGLTGVWQCAFDERYCVAAVQRNGRSEFDVLDFGSAAETDAGVAEGVPASSSIAPIGDPNASQEPPESDFEQRIPYVYDESVFRDSPLARVASRRTTGDLVPPALDFGQPSSSGEGEASASRTDSPSRSQADERAAGVANEEDPFRA